MTITDRPPSDGVPVRPPGFDADETIGAQAVEALVKSVSVDFPSASRTDVIDLVVESLAETRQARVQTFRLLLAERYARRCLSQSATTPPATKEGTTWTS